MHVEFKVNHVSKRGPKYHTQLFRENDVRTLYKLSDQQLIIINTSENHFANLHSLSTHIDLIEVYMLTKHCSKYVIKSFHLTSYVLSFVTMQSDKCFFL